MTESQKTSLSVANRKELYEKLRGVWDLGANVIIGWRGADSGIELLYVPGRGLPRAGKAHPELLERSRHVDDQAAFKNLIAAGCESVVIPLSFDIHENQATIGEMNAIIRYYTVTHSRCRAVGLFDIVNFSLYSAFERITQINVLAHHVNLAAARVEAAGLPIDLTMSTTGDGFYLWNRKEGLPADLAIFYVTGLAMAYNRLALEDCPREIIPQLRCCLDFGDHYEYYQASGTKPDSRGFIVGDVTINLARLISAALPHQFLIGSYIRELGDNDDGAREVAAISRIDTPTFLSFALKNARLLLSSPVGAAKIARVNTYLTGERVSDNEYTIRKYDVVDKHGLSHRCFNAKFNITDTTDRSIRVGLLTAELDRFEARHIENEDIRLKILASG